MYIPDIRTDGYDDYYTVYVGSVKIGTAYFSGGFHEVLDELFAKLLKSGLESIGIRFDEDYE